MRVHNSQPRRQEMALGGVRRGRRGGCGRRRRAGRLGLCGGGADTSLATGTGMYKL